MSYSTTLDADAIKRALKLKALEALEEKIKDVAIVVLLHSNHCGACKEFRSQQKLLKTLHKKYSDKVVIIDAKSICAEFSDDGVVEVEDLFKDRDLRGPFFKTLPYYKGVPAVFVRPKYGQNLQYDPAFARYEEESYNTAVKNYKPRTLFQRLLGM